MRISLPIECVGCHSIIDATCTTTGHQLTAKCPHCSHDNSGPVSGFNIGEKLLLKAVAEHKNEEYELTIVFAAMAVDCETSRLYIKWAGIRELQNKRWISDKQLEERLRKSHRSFRAKLNALEKLICLEGSQAYVLSQEPLAKAAKKRCITNVAEQLEQELFWKRNRIVHVGQSRAIKEEAARAIQLAEFAIGMLDGMDRRQQARV